MHLFLYVSLDIFFSVWHVIYHDTISICNTLICLLIITANIYEVITIYRYCSMPFTVNKSFNALDKTISIVIIPIFNVLTLHLTCLSSFIPYVFVSSTLIEPIAQP